MEENQTEQIAPPKKNLLPFILIGGVVLLILLAIIGIVIGLSVIKSPPTTVQVASPTPIPKPSPFEVLAHPNAKFASDSALLKLRDNLKALDAEIGSANFYEPQISPPNLDLNLQIE